jgi:hypothetical protein
MIRYWKPGLLVILIFLFSGLIGGADVLAAEKPTDDAKVFPRSLDSYNDADVDSISKILISRAKQEPFNLIATLIFLCAIIHTFLTGKFMTIAHKWEDAHEQKIKKGLCRRTQTCRGGWRRCRRRPDGDCQRTEPGRSVDFKKILWQRSVSGRYP